MSQIFISCHLALNHTYQLHLLQGTQDAGHFQLTFYEPTSKLPLQLSGPEINTNSTITRPFCYKFVDTG